MQVALDAALLSELFARRDALVRTIQAGAASGRWEPVMPAFDAMLAAIAELEEATRRGGRPSGVERTGPEQG
jgi:hypothetical protein